MSRIGKKLIELPQGVTIAQKDGIIMTQGPKGELSVPLPNGFSVRQEDSQVFVDPPQQKTQQTPALWGLTRSLLANSVIGVTKGFTKKLVIEGIGYRAEVQGNDIVLNLGFSHPIRLPALGDVQFSVEKNVITVSGIDKYQVGEMAARIRRCRKPEPYKGKGIRYEDEHVRRKAGKKAVASAL